DPLSTTAAGQSRAFGRRKRDHCPPKSLRSDFRPLIPARAAGARSGAAAAAGTSARAAGHGRDSPRGASTRGAMQQEIREQRRGSAGTALLRAAQVRGAGDIQMRPFEALREFAEEPGGGDRAAVTAADVGEVREVAFEL